MSVEIPKQPSVAQESLATQFCKDVDTAVKVAAFVRSFIAMSNKKSDDIIERRKQNSGFRLSIVIADDSRAEIYPDDWEEGATNRTFIADEIISIDSNCAIFHDLETEQTLEVYDHKFETTPLFSTDSSPIDK